MDLCELSHGSHEYCKECGKKTRQADIMGYDDKSGEPIYRMICPSGLCEHAGIWHDMAFISNGWLLDLIGGRDFKCKRCGYTVQGP